MTVKKAKTTSIKNKNVQKIKRKPPFTG